jgi:hypothetical protein
LRGFLELELEDEAAGGWVVLEDRGADGERVHVRFPVEAEGRGIFRNEAVACGVVGERVEAEVSAVTQSAPPMVTFREVKVNQF